MKYYRKSPQNHVLYTQSCGFITWDGGGKGSGRGTGGVRWREEGREGCDVEEG